MTEPKTKAREGFSRVPLKGVLVPGTGMKLGIALLIVLLAGSCSLLGSRAGLNGGFENVVRDVGVDLCCGDVAVAEGLLNQEQVASAVQQRSGEGVPQGVWCDGFIDPGSLHPAWDKHLHSPSLQTTTLLVEEKGISLDSIGSFLAQVGINGLAGSSRQELDDRAAALRPVDAKMFPINIIDIQAHQLPDTQASVQQQQYDGVVPDRMSLVCVIAQASQQQTLLLVGQVDGWFLLDVDRSQRSSWIDLDEPRVNQPTEERAHCRLEPIHAVWTTRSAVRQDLVLSDRSFKVFTLHAFWSDLHHLCQTPEITPEGSDRVARLPGSSQMGLEPFRCFIPRHSLLPDSRLPRIQPALDVATRQGKNP